MTSRRGVASRLIGVALIESALLFVLVIGAARITKSATAALALAGMVFLVIVLLSARRTDRLCRRSTSESVHHGLGHLAAALSLVISCLLWLTPLGPPPAVAASPSSTSPSTPRISYLSRPDGTRLALRRYGHANPAAGPMIVVHGGPGIPVPPREQHLFAGLGERQVIIFDQIGTGSSTHLEDPGGYTMARSISDLQAVIDSTGAPQVVLLGHSWGAQIVTQFAARHPDQVEAMILAAPAPIIWAGQAPPPVGPQSRLSTGTTMLTYARALLPRNLFTYLLAAADPQTAHAMAGDQEMDARFAALIRSTSAGLYCDPSLAADEDISGVGFYANQQPQLQPDGVGLTSALVPELAQIPTLVLRPACDYIPETLTRGYEKIIPGAELTIVPDAGHSLFVEQPRTSRRLVDDFLRRSAR